MNLLATAPAVSPAEQNVIDTLLGAGFQEQDGWFYPAGGPERAAVRFSVFGGQFQIWRRRTLRGGWMTIAVADVEDFDAGAFAAWRDSWPLTH